MVSIIVPVFNVERYIHRCIDSLINQTYQDIEIILVDDGSTDSSGLICDNYKEKDKRINVIHRENGGLTSAVKLGLSVANGEYIAFVDSDDWVELNYIETMYEAMIKNNCELVCANAYQNAGNEVPMQLHNCKDGIYREKDIRDHIYPGLFCCIDSIGYRIAPARWAKLFLREKLLENIKYYKDNIQLGEDSLMTYPYILTCKDIICINNHIYHYLINQSSISHQFKKKNLEDLTLCIREYEAMSKELSVFDFTNQLCAKKTEIIYRTLHEIAKSTHAKNRKEMFRYFKSSINYYTNYSVIPYSKKFYIRLQYRLIQQKQVVFLWLLMIIKKLFEGKIIDGKC